VTYGLSGAIPANADIACDDKGRLTGRASAKMQVE
jgi:hypothetical protein